MKIPVLTYTVGRDTLVFPRGCLGLRSTLSIHHCNSPSVTSRPLPAASSGMVLTSHQPRSELGSFKATRTPRYGCSLEPKVQEDTARKLFIAWFDTACANLDPRVKHRALLAGKDAALAIIAEARRESEE